jgi:hypothetical protein
MRIVFDQGTPAPLRRALSGLTVATAFELGWSNLAHGDLLQQAEAQFDLLITTDQDLRYQQNLAGRRLAILVFPEPAGERIFRLSEPAISQEPVLTCSTDEGWDFHSQAKCQGRSQSRGPQTIDH